MSTNRSDDISSRHCGCAYYTGVRLEIPSCCACTWPPPVNDGSGGGGGALPDPAYDDWDWNPDVEGMPQSDWRSYGGHWSFTPQARDERASGENYTVRAPRAA